jgi:hypothetical protein
MGAAHLNIEPAIEKTMRLDGHSADSHAQPPLPFMTWHFSQRNFLKDPVVAHLENLAKADTVYFLRKS